MIGFIKKDFAMIKSNFKLLGILTIIYLIMGLIGTMDLSFILPLISITIMISTFSYDNYNKWDAYVISLPNGRKNSVKAKYITTILMTLITSIAGMIVSFIISYYNTNTVNLEQIILSMLSAIFSTFLVLTFMYPMIYKFGIEKSRIGMLLFFFGFAIIGSIVAKANSSIVADLSLFFQKWQIVILTILPIFLLFLSYRISLKLELKKEF